MSKRKTEEQSLLEERQKKIAEFEAFINDRLKVDLDNILSQRDQVYADIAQYLELRNTLLTIKEQKLKEMTTLVNLGTEFYVQAQVPDTSRLFVNIGLGFHAEMTQEETLAFVKRKEVELNKKADAFTAQATDLKLQIRVMYEHLDQLLNLPGPSPLRRVV